jgi:hypothetical protein
MELASCGNKYFRTNFIYAVPSSLLIAPGLRTIQFLFSLFFSVKKAFQKTNILLYKIIEEQEALQQIFG